MEWLEGLKGGAPTVVGAIIGALLGFLTLVLGALFNAHLNRLRDDNLRKQETRSVAAAICAEFQSLVDILEYNAKKLEEPAQEEFFFVPDLSHSVRMFPALVDKIGLLGDTTLIMNVTQAYIVIDQYCENLLMIGGRMGEGFPEHRRLICTFK